MRGIIRWLIGMASMGMNSTSMVNSDGSPTRELSARCRDLYTVCVDSFASTATASRGVFLAHSLWLDSESGSQLVVLRKGICLHVIVR